MEETQSEVKAHRRTMIEIGRRRRRGSKLSNWFCFRRNSFLLPGKSTLLRLISCLSHTSNGNANGLRVLYEDMESCGEYADIRVMWDKMVQSFSPSELPKQQSNQEALDVLVYAELKKDLSSSRDQSVVAFKV